jgi:DNA-binding FrmR family transcriptional regulator
MEGSMNTRAYTKEPTKSKILHRLKIARGHLDKVIKMAEGDSYCIDVIHQSQAVQAALKGVDKTILDNHLRSCVLGRSKNGKIMRKLVKR